MQNHLEIRSKHYTECTLLIINEIVIFKNIRFLSISMNHKKRSTVLTAMSIPNIKMRFFKS